MLKISSQRGAVSTTVAIIIVIAAVAIFFLARTAAPPGPLDGFARCLKDKGTVFYGTFWCKYCQKQKKMFGRSTRLLPYVECSTANGQGTLPICRENKITGYPTWVFPDQSRESGVIPLEKLAARSGCSLTASSTNPTDTASATATSTQP